MPAKLARPLAGKNQKRRRVGVIDVGSNSIRLVVYDCSGAVPYLMFNEKALCGLGRGLAETGRLNPTGVKLAMATLARLVALCRAMKLQRTVALATAAVREATDGTAFVRTVAQNVGIRLRVLSGDEEAALSAASVQAGIPDADGVVGDLGGGSLELVALRQGNQTGRATLPLGPLRLLDAGSKKKITRIVQESFDSVPWLAEMKGRNLYLVGGSWRAIGKLHLAQSHYPLNVIHGYTVAPVEMLKMTGQLAALSGAALEKIAAVPKARADVLPPAAYVLGKFIGATAPKGIVFSGYGLREGYVFRHFAKDLKDVDSLIAVCADLGARFGRFDIAEALFDWMTPIFPGETQKQARWRRAACYVSDIAWMEHTPYQAEHAFFRILRMPFIGTDHETRAFLALTIHHRYGGRMNDEATQGIQRLLKEKEIWRARAVGRVLRLAYTLSGGTKDLIKRTRLYLENGAPRLWVPNDSPVFFGVATEDSLRALTAALQQPKRPATVKT